MTSPIDNASPDDAVRIIGACNQMILQALRTAINHCDTASNIADGHQSIFLFHGARNAIFELMEDPRLKALGSAGIPLSMLVR